MRTAFLIFVLLAMSCAVAHAQYDEGEYEVMAVDDELDTDSEFEVYGGEQLQTRALAKQTYTAPVRMEELPPIQNKATYLPAQMHKTYSTQKQMRTKAIPVHKTQTVLIRQPIVRTQRYKQPVIQPVVTQPVVTTRIVTQPVKQPMLTTKTVTQPMIYTQPIIVRRLSQKFQTNTPLQRTKYSTNGAITQQTRMLTANPIENPPQYFNLPAQTIEESGKEHSSSNGSQLQLNSTDPQLQQFQFQEQQQQLPQQQLQAEGEQEQQPEQEQQQQQQQFNIGEQEQQAMPQQLAAARVPTTAVPTQQARLSDLLALVRGRL